MDRFKAVRISAGPNLVTYDDAWRLTEASYAGGRQVSYDLNPLGNRLSVIEDGSVTPFVPNALNQYTSVAGTARTFDGNGNLTGDGQRVLLHDSENRLKAVTVQLSNGPVVVSYDHDAFGRRVTRWENGERPSRYT